VSKRTSVVNISGDFEETIERLARHLGKEKVRRVLFDTIYGRGSKLRSKKQLMEAAGLRDERSQQAQNALDHLARHHLIVKEPNDGSVRDGSRFMYGKDETVRANRERIVKLANNPALADRTPTKRRQVVTKVISVRKVKVSELRKRKKLVVLFLTANPDAENSLRVDAEVRRVQQAIRGSKFAENVQVEYRPAADLQTILDGLNDLRPQVVHFSGHGTDGGLLTDTGELEEDPSDELSYSLLGKALHATDHPPDVVVLNSCSSSHAKNDVLPKVKFLVSMNVPISDIAAAAFAPQFYAALASGQSVQSAFKQGDVAVEAASISEAATPALHANKADASKVVLT
jgi:hypothetical protein